MTTFVLLGSQISLILLSLLLWALLLQLGLRWGRVPGATWRRSLLLGLINTIIASTMVFMLGALLKRVPNSELVEASAGVGIGFLVSVALIMRCYKTSYVEAVKAWLPTLLASIALVPFMMFVYKPFVYEGFKIPTNGMAPTLIGNYVVGRCPDCGAPMYGSDPNDPQIRGSSNAPIKMICTNFHSHKTTEHDAGGHALDRIMVAKFLTPRRWDIVALRDPSEAKTIQAKRVVGLPGETVTIRDGEIFINDAKVDPPADLKGIRHLTTIPDGRQSFEALWGTVEHPAVLGPDEYFVLGDNTTASFDSRFWQQGAEGHPPYAVPKSHLIGVATHIHWPRERIRVLR